MQNAVTPDSLDTCEAEARPYTPPPAATATPPDGWTAEQFKAAKNLAGRFNALLGEADDERLVVTVTLVPTKPLRMGGYFPRVDIRPAREG